MNLPTIPTDNLYKFVFFIGLLLMIYCRIVLDSKVQELEQRLYESDKAMVDFQFNSKAITKNYDKVNALANEAK